RPPLRAVRAPELDGALAAGLPAMQPPRSNLLPVAEEADGQRRLPATQGLGRAQPAPELAGAAGIGNERVAFDMPRVALLVHLDRCHPVVAVDDIGGAVAVGGAASAPARHH